MKFSEKIVTYDNIKSHKKLKLQPLSRKNIFGKQLGGQIDPTPPAVFRVIFLEECCCILLRIKEKFKFYYRDKEIEIAKQNTYLGFTFTRSGKKASTDG